MLMTKDKIYSFNTETRNNFSLTHAKRNTPLFYQFKGYGQEVEGISACALAL